LDLCIDLIVINNVVALTGIDKQVKYRHFVEMPNRTKESLYAGIDKIFRIYNHADFVVKRIYCDMEFKPVLDPVKDELEIHMNYTSAGEHEPTAERNNQHIKAGVRTLFHRMPYKAIPKLLTASLGRRVVETSNYYPAKGGISGYYSPHTIILRRRVDFARNFVAEIGSYVQGFGHETHRNQRTRTVDGIYLGPSPNTQKGHLLMDLNTGRQIQRTNVKVLPATKQVIDIVEQMARDEGVTELRTYSRRTGAVILDADLLAGVDPDELWDEEFDPNEEDEPLKSDENLRNEHIDEDEVNDLIDDLDDFVHIEDDDRYEDEVLDRIITRMNQRKKKDNNDNDDDDYEMIDNKGNEQNHHPDEDYTYEEQDNALDELAMQLNELEQDERSEEIYFEPDGNNETDNESDDDSMPELVRREPDNNDKEDDDSDDESVSSVVEDNTKNRTARAFWQDGVKMRPTVRNGQDRLKFSAYHNKPKKKQNLKKNRSAMRRKERINKLRVLLQQALKEERAARRPIKQRLTKNQKRENEIKHNLFLQQTSDEHKNYYARDHARMIARVIQDEKSIQVRSMLIMQIKKNIERWIRLTFRTKQTRGCKKCQSGLTVTFSSC
jgi:hypothetical protein